jgi:hypothetical protein
MTAASGAARIEAAIGAARTVEPPSGVPDFPKMDPAAFYGLAGEIVRTIAPHSEADPIALLVQFLASFGSVIGGGPYYQVEADQHHPNIFGVLVGTSSKARKGTSAGRIRSVLRGVDDRWVEERVKGGLSSGEGLIAAVSDEIRRYDSKTRQFEVVDPGATDKRLLIEEAEFASALAAMDRHGNTLSPVIRNAWDARTLSTLTKNSPLKATGAHISIIGHITQDELRARMTSTEAANGFANRFLFFACGDLSACRLAAIYLRRRSLPLVSASGKSSNPRE